MERTEEGDLLAPGAIVGSYRVERRVDGGGFGDVYLAQHRLLATPVALKVPRRPVAERAWRREAALQSHLAHANIVRVLDVVDLAGVAVLVMEYVDGCSLSRALRLRRVPAEERSRIVGLVTRAVSYAHALNVVHLDLKPGNVLLFRDGDRLSLKVCDFGLARVRAHAAPLTGDRWQGTPAYMAPEQFGGEVGARTDVFALGCLIYELFAGVRPFTGTWMEIAYAKQAGLYTPLALLHPELERESAIVDRCLQPEPEDRYPDARELLRDWSPTGRATRSSLSFLPSGKPLARTPVPIPRSSVPPA